eukprot:GSA25T00023156001.1
MSVVLDTEEQNSGTVKAGGEMNNLQNEQEDRGTMIKSRKRKRHATTKRSTASLVDVETQTEDLPAIACGDGEGQTEPLASIEGEAQTEAEPFACVESREMQTEGFVGASVEIQTEVVAGEVRMTQTEVVEFTLAQTQTETAVAGEVETQTEAIAGRIAETQTQTTCGEATGTQ